jgi:hypothetical protein
VPYKARPSDGERTQEPGCPAIGIEGTREKVGRMLRVEAAGQRAGLWRRRLQHCRRRERRHLPGAGRPRRGRLGQELWGGDWEGGESRWFRSSLFPERGSPRVGRHSAPTQTGQRRRGLNQHAIRWPKQSDNATFPERNPRQRPTDQPGVLGTLGA